jgi:AcrR family transcriptional regulator
MLTHRADFARNERRILDAAAHVLAATPTAGVAEIAVAAGVGRATVYRHFPTREALLAGLGAEALEAASGVVERNVRPVLEGWEEAPSATTALRTLSEELVDVGDRYRLILAGPADERERSAARRRFEEPLVQLVEHAQAAGELDAGVPARWVLVALGGVLGRVLEELADGRVTPGEAKRLVVHALLDGFRARR